MAYLYLIENENGRHHYLGSALDFNVRLDEHNRGVTKATRNKGPWKILKTWKFDSIKEVKQIEYKIKRMKHKLSEEYISYFIREYSQNNG
ncbi:MAG: hypothetical protein A2469_01705 [Candidatus Magasanikbacteria bacterium RIFOXYC2_FULL_40_16]|uniref:GIY-YIG domain-containing protein n=1 Tax=Candidatus Magasanikbacteria bacterium RIFOXYC2_FULL_40_16 TaxID=1798703 RepID=A0A1F6NZJ6_9BACT|nr:MAG: hypothetical protein A2469_01705 [Candidatus Magasanikbacteria bacterium RIFOXYC2_FULL_40_16]